MICHHAHRLAHHEGYTEDRAARRVAGTLRCKKGSPAAGAPAREHGLIRLGNACAESIHPAAGGGRGARRCSSCTWGTRRTRSARHIPLFLGPSSACSLAVDVDVSTCMHSIAVQPISDNSLWVRGVAVRHAQADFETLAAKTDGFSGSDVNVVVKDVLMEPVRKTQEATHFRLVCRPQTIGGCPLATGKLFEPALACATLILRGWQAHSSFQAAFCGPHTTAILAGSCR